MNGYNCSNDDVVECPLCMEPLEVDDLNFYPCTCGYQICRFCWHRIRTDENKLCPACRKEYPENPADFTPLTQEQMIAFKSQKRQRDQQRKQKITENRKHLANVRVVQKNLVFVVGLPPRLADADILKKHEYFGKYGKIHKVVINPSTTYAGVQGPSASAYVTYVHNCDALRAIQSVNNIMIDGRLIKTSLGTTKYCSHFMKNQQCPKSDCMYLHELGDAEASFTKEEMHQGKHQEYEKRLHDALIATAGMNTSNGLGQTSVTNIGTSGGGSTKPIAISSSSSSSISSTSAISTQNSDTSNSAIVTNQQHNEAWPSLCVSPVNIKETSTGAGNTKNNNKKDKLRNEKVRNEKSIKNKSKNVNSNITNKENNVPDSRVCINVSNSNITESPTKTDTSKKTEQVSATSNSKLSTEINKDKLDESNLANNKDDDEHEKDKNASVNSVEDEEKSTEHSSKRSSNLNSRGLGKTSSILVDNETHNFADSSVEDHTSPTLIENNGSSMGTSIMKLYKEPSNRYSESTLETNQLIKNMENNVLAKRNIMMVECDKTSNSETDIQSKPSGATVIEQGSTREATSSPIDTTQFTKNVENEIMLENAATLSKLKLFDDSNSFFSAPTSFQQTLLKNKLSETRQNQINNTPHLPDLLSGIDGYQKASTTNEWEEAFKNVMMRNNKHVEEQLLHQQHLQQQQQQHHQQLLQQQEEFLRIHEMQKRNNSLNNIGLSTLNGPHNDSINFQGDAADLSRLSHASLLQQQQLQLQQQNQSANDLFGANMSKFFDFHKNQQQLHQQYFSGNPNLNSTSITDPLRIASYLENNRVNAQCSDNNPLTHQQQIQKQRLLGKFETMSQNLAQQPPKALLPNPFSKTSMVDDDLGFDPFIETQKGLAELMENEIIQQQSCNTMNNAITKMLPHQQTVPQPQFLENMQRARMPPPGFNHMNALNFGVSRGQNNSKMLPFMNVTNNGGTADPQSNAQVQNSNWNSHLTTYQQQQLALGENQLHNSVNPNHCPGSHIKGFSNNDWTAMDPAILSFRQFSSLPQQPQMPPHPQQHQQLQDIFMQHISQQNQSPQNFSNPAYIVPGINLSNTIQPSSQASVNTNVQGMLEFLKNRQFV